MSTELAPYTRDGRVPLDDPELEKFAHALVKHGGCQSPAFREVFPGRAELATRNSLWVMAHRVASDPRVDARYNALRTESLARVSVSLATLVQDLHDIATADPRELVRTVIVNCRHCHGVGFAYQWIDENEYCDACDKVQADNDLRREQSTTKRTVDKPLPTCEGGFGFNVTIGPNDACPQCLGAGLRHTIVADMGELSDKGRKLYKGVKIKGDGSLEILMHDQMAARDQLHRMAGAYKDGAKLPGDPGADPGDAIDMRVVTPDSAKDLYMSLVHGDV